jgi:hypothetical protein
MEFKVLEPLHANLQYMELHYLPRVRHPFFLIFNFFVKICQKTEFAEILTREICFVKAPNFDIDS